MAVGELAVLIEQLNSVVFAGSFPHGLLDERELFGGDIDNSSIVRVNPIIQCSYASGKYHLALTPDRIDVKANELDTVVSAELAEAAQVIASRLDEHRNLATARAIGINCDGVIRQSAVGMTGSEYCTRLASANVQRLAGASSFKLKFNILLFESPLQYSVRIGPHAMSHGDNLFVAVNGHQQVGGADLLSEKLLHIDNFRHFVKKLHKRIVSETEGQVQ